MKGVHVGLDDTTIHFAREAGIIIEKADAADADEFVEWLKSGVYEFAAVDLTKKRFGIFLPRAIRNEHIATSILGISHEPDDVNWHEHRSQFLENGGDDLIRGPANPRELVASIRAMTRRYKGSLSDIIVRRCGDAVLKINIGTWDVRINGIQIHLTGKEMRMLVTLAESPGRTLSKEQLLTSLYTLDTDEPEIKIIDVFICKLRKKLAHACGGENYIETVWGRGYVLRDPDDMSVIEAA